MGSAVSTPLALNERNSPYIQKPELSYEFYSDHVEGKQTSRPLLSEVPAELLHKVSLHQSVDLSFNIIKELPLDLPLSLPHLKSLNLSHNRISGLPDSIFGFLHLQLLDLSFNHIEELPPSICLLDNLKKLNLSNNLLKKLPANIDELISLEKINLVNNHLDHLPISLGNISTLKVLLIAQNPISLSAIKDVISTTSCTRLIDHLRQCYERSRSPTHPLSVVNCFNRTRGSVFDSRVLNAGSAQSLFGQMQAQAVNTGNRLLTPMIPPSSATTLNAEKLKDAILGMFYGSVIGDSLGLLTDFMTPVESKFHYDAENLTHSDILQDERRSSYGMGQVSSASHLLVVALESVLKWAGVVDELDYTSRLTVWYDQFKETITSSVLHGVIKDKEYFISSPATAAKLYLENLDNDDNQDLKTVDNMCLPPIVGLVVSQFYDLCEVTENARRICGSTHHHSENRRNAILLAQILSNLLKGESLNTVTSKIDVTEHNYHVSHPSTCINMLIKHIKTFESEGYRGALTSIVMHGGHASVNGLVAGSVFGMTQGYQALPLDWLKNIDSEFKKNLDKKLNLLFDMMGVP